MAKRNICDVNGREVEKGDTVATMNGSFSGKVCELTTEGGVGFVRIRAAHTPFGKGVWHAADQVQVIARPKKKV